MGNQTTYKGEYFKGMRSGFGSSHDRNGGKYQGNWEENWQTGRGIYTWQNGIRYEGM